MTTILITGVGRGIGHALALHALNQGWRVLGSVRQARDAVLLADLAGDRFKELVFDVRDSTAIDAAAKGVDEPIDVLVNCSGIIGPDRQSTLDMDYDASLTPLPSTRLGRCG